MKRLFVALVMAGLSACTSGRQCTSDAQCTEFQAVCDTGLGVCIAADAGSGDGGATDGGSGGSMDGGDGGSTDGGDGGSTDGGDGGATDGGGDGGAMEVSYCDAGLGCADYEECTPTVDGGSCINQDLTITWTSPAQNTVFAAPTTNASFSVTKADGGAVSLTTVPVSNAMPFTGSNGNYAGQLVLAGGEGMKLFEAGWAPPGPSSMLILEKDTRAPSVAVAVQPRPSGLADGEPGFETYWKKDEAALVWVTVDGGRPAQAGDVMTTWSGAVTSATCPMCTGNCRCFAVDVAGSTINGMRGGLELRVGSIPDAVGNLSAPQDAGISVTRFKWARALPGSASRLLPVAVSRTGLVVAGVDENSASTSIRLVGLSQDGGTNWSASGLGTITAGPVVGTNEVWVGTQTVTNSQLQPFTLAAGTTGTPLCGLVTTSAFLGDLAMAPLNGGATETPFGVRGGDLHVFAGGNCRAAQLTNPVPADVTTRASLVVRSPDGGSTEAFMAYESDTRLWKAELTGSSWSDRGSAALPAGISTRGLYVDNAGFVGGGGGVSGVGAIFATDAGATFSAATGFAQSTAPNSGPPSVGSGFVLYGTSAGDLVKVGYTAGNFGTSSTAAAGVGNLQSSTPLLGAGALAYVVGSSGTLTVRRTSDLSEVWSAPIASVSAGSDVSKTALDAYRDAMSLKDCTKPLGILYVATKIGTSATLRAILVDSKGLDGTAPWPKYQRDNANTGNASLTLDPWTCP